MTIASGATSGTGTFTLTPADDAVDEADETITVSGSSGTLTVNATTLALTDDDATPAVDLSVSPTSVDEGDGATTVTVTATLNPTTVTFPADTAVTVSVTDSNTSGVVGFTAVSDITVTIASGATSGTGTFTLTPADDAVDEADETITVSGSSGTLTVNATTLALTDDDATPAVDLSVSPTSVDEGDGATTVTVTATLNPTTVTFPADTAVTVSVTDSNTSGVVGFTAVSDITVTIASGATSGTGTFTLTPADDAVDEADETITVSGSSGTLTVNATTLALTDDDATPAVDLSVSPTSVDEGDGATTVTVTATLNPTTVTFPADTAVTVSVTDSNTSGVVGFTAVSDITVTIASGATSGTGTFTLTPADDAVDEADETITVSGSSGTLTVNATTLALTDDDATPAVDLSVSPTSVDEGDGATTVTVTATLNPTTVTFPADTAVTVSVTDSNTSGVVGFTAVSDITVTIASGATSGTGTFTLTPADDAVDEADETITVSGSSGTLTVNETTLALTDDDATPAVDLSVSPTSVDEGDGATTVTVTATLNPTTVTFPADTAVTVSVTDSNTSGVVGFTAVSDITVTIASGATSGTGTFTLTPADDAVDEADETITVSGSSGTLTVNETTLALTDDDATPAVDLSVSPTSVDEGDGATTVTVTATLNPTTVTFPADTAVTVSVTDSNTSGVVGFTAVSDITVTIASGATSGTGTFTLTPADDAVDEADETITVSGSSGTLTVNETTLALTDDDATPAVDLSVSPTSVDEGDGATTVTVTATLPGSTFATGQTMTVAIGATGDAAAEGTDYAAVADITVSIAAGATSATGTFSIDPTQDVLDEGTGENLSVEGTLTGVTITQTELTIADDDVASDSIVLEVNPTSLDESDAATTVTVTASFGNPTVLGSDTQVTVQVTGNTATEGTDFTTDTGDTDFVTVIIAAMASSGMKTFTLTPISDVLMEGDETVTVSGTATGFMVTGTEVTIIDDKVGARKARTAVNREVLPQVTQAMAASTVTAVTGRIDAVTSGVGQVPSYNLASQQTLAGIMQTVSQGLGNGSLTIERLLGGSSFVLPLHATNDGQQTGLRSLAIWGNGDYRNLGGGKAIEWDGEIFSGHLGVDTRLSANLLVGLAASLSKGSFDYAGLSGTDTTAGSYTTRMTSVHPYVNWSSPAGVDLWGSLGYGWGELGIDEQGALQTESRDTTMQTAAVGANGKVLSVAGLIPGGRTILRLKGEALLTKIKVEGDGGGIEPLSLEARRFRLALEGSHEHQLASGGRLVPAVEIGVRHDGGDGVEGTGLELGGGLRYVDPTIGLTIDGRGRALVTYGEQEYREWGASLLIRMDPGAAGQGLSLSLVPSYGQTASGVTRLWDQGMDGFGEASTSDASPRLEAVVGYGLPTLEGNGLLTPYSGVTLGSGGHQLRLGSTLAVGSSFNVSLEGTQAMRSEATSREATPVYGVRLQADWRF